MPSLGAKASVNKNTRRIQHPAGLGFLKDTVSSVFPLPSGVVGYNFPPNGTTNFTLTLRPMLYTPLRPVAAFKSRYFRRLWCDW